MPDEHLLPRTLLALLRRVNGRSVARRSAGQDGRAVFGALLLAGCLSCGLIPRGFADSSYSTALAYTTGTELTTTAPIAAGTRYSRVIRLQQSGSLNGTLLATFESVPNNLGIYRSNDDGLTWTQISTCPETQFAGFQFRVEPDLFELPVQTGNLPAGTLLLVANAQNGQMGHQLEIYYSLDHGMTWQYRGMADNNATTPGGMWEPHLDVTSDGQLVCYYSDERFQPTYNQLLGERVSPDGGLTWGDEIYAVAIPDGTQRPGMAVTAHLPNGQRVMSYETWPAESGHVHIKFSNDGVHWGSGPSDYGTAVQTASGAYPGATPYIAWLPVGGVNGTLVLSAHFLLNSPLVDRELFLNTNLGQGNWTTLPAPVQWQGGGNRLAGWSQAMIPTADGLGILHLASSQITVNGNADENEMLFGRERLILPGTTYQFANQNSGLAVNIPGNSTASGTGLQQGVVDGGTAQHWTFSEPADNVWTVTNPADQLAWSDDGASTTVGTVITQASPDNTTSQQWNLQPVGDGSWKFLNVCSGFALAVVDASRQAGAALVQAADGDGAEQRWQSQDPRTTSVPTFFTNEVALSQGVYYLALANGNPFGYYSFLSDLHYVYHFDLGYEYVFDAKDGKSGVYLYDFTSNTFWYTSPSFPFPYLYDFSLNAVLYYYPDPNNPGRYNTNGVRYFYNFSTGKIITK